MGIEEYILTDAEISRLTEDEQAEYTEHIQALYWAEGKESFLEFCKRVEVPGVPSDEDDTDVYFPQRVTPAAHHRLLIDAIQKLADGSYPDVDGVMVFTPPGAAKTSYLSVLAPAWLMGRKKGTNVIAISYSQDVANRFGRRVRYIVRGADYNKVMATGIVGDNQAVDNWALENGSDYRAAGANASVTSFRADWVLIDDPIKGREAADSQLQRDTIWTTLNDDVFTRMKPGAKIGIAMTRWSEDDPASRILGEAWKGQSGFWRGTDERLWLIINLPLLAEHKDDPLGRKLHVHKPDGSLVKDDPAYAGDTYGEMLWPEWFREKEAFRLARVAKKGGTAARTWSSLYQQRPRPSDGAILARSYWRPWPEKKDLPECSAIYLSYDTAFEEKEQNDPSAMTAWGVFKHISRKTTGEEFNHDHVILLGAWNEQVDAVRLMDIAITGYDFVDDHGNKHRMQSHVQLFKPDLILVEKRASGIQLIQEMRRKRVPVKEWLPRGRAKDKVARAHAVATFLEQGSVWYVPGSKTEQVLEQCAAFPFGKNDDLVDTCTQMLAYFRDRYIFRTAEDEMDEDEIKDRMLARSDERRSKRTLYSGPMNRAQNDYDAEEIRNMTPETRRRLYG